MEFGITYTKRRGGYPYLPVKCIWKSKSFRAFVYGYGFICPEHPESVYEAMADREIFPNSERKLALDKSQMLLLLAHHIVSLLPVLGSGILRTFLDGYRYWQNIVQCIFARYVCECGRAEIPIAVLGVG